MTEVLKPERLGEKILLLTGWRERCLQQRQVGYPVRDVNRSYGNMCKRYTRWLQKGIAEDSGLGKINGKSVTNNGNGGSQHHSSYEPQLTEE